MKMKVIGILLLLINIVIYPSSTGYRILAIYPRIEKSHFNMLNGLLKGLTNAGHKVDLISMFPQERNSSITQVITIPPDSDAAIVTFDSIKNDKNYLGARIGRSGYKKCRHLGNPEIQNLIKNPPKYQPYDAIILQSFNYHCYMAIGHLWNLPVILITTTSLYPWMHDMIGNPENIAFTPNNMVSIPEGKGLWNRFCNTFWFYTLKLIYAYHSRNQVQLLKKYFGSEVPSLQKLERSAALVLTNTYFPVNGVRPMATNLIEVGGLHIQDNGSELPDDLKKWLDESGDGVIYFSLGSVTKIDIFPEKILKILFKSLEQLSPIRVLIRIAKPEELSLEIPNNFYTLSWIPQEKVLQHPNVRLFITHGGSFSTQEAIHYGVPMLCMPLFADQYSNSENCVSQKIAVMIDVITLTKKRFDDVLYKILNNKMYSENIKRLSKMFRDRSQSPLDTAIFWIEFVIRNGKDSMRSPAMDLTWWQVALLDVFFVLIIGFTFIIYISVIISKIICFMFKRRKKLHNE